VVSREGEREGERKRINTETILWNSSPDPTDYTRSAYEGSISSRPPTNASAVPNIAVSHPDTVSPYADSYFHPNAKSDIGSNPWSSIASLSCTNKQTNSSDYRYAHSGKYRHANTNQFAANAQYSW